jgi:hypothetical protein
MAKKKKKKATKKKRRSYVANPVRRVKSVVRKKRRSYKRNPGIGPMADIVKLGAGATIGAIAVPRVTQFIPGETMVKNLSGLALSGAIAYFGRKNKIALGAGLGGLAITARNLVVNSIPMLAGDELTQEEAEALAMEYAGEYDEDLNEFGAPLMGAPLMGAPLMGDYNQSNY